MLRIFRKRPKRASLYPRKERVELNGDVYIKRPGQSILRANQGNICEGGLHIHIPNHGLERGKKVEIVLVSKKGSLRRMSRMMGIIIRGDDKNLAMVTYKKQDLNSQPDFSAQKSF